MLRSRVRRRVHIPDITTKKTQTKDYEYVKGFNTNQSNDDVPTDEWRYATDVREYEVGKWDTRQGTDLFSIPIGEAVNVQQTSVTGASTFSFNGSTWWAKKVVATSTGYVTAIEANLKNAASATGTIVLALYSDSSGAPGTELFRTTIAGSTPTSSLAYCKGRSITCPQITNGSTYWVIGFVQADGSGSYAVSTTTNASTGLTSTSSGTTWAAASLDFNVKVSTSTAGAVKGLKRVQRPDGTTYTFFAHGSTLYSVNEGTGVTTAIDTGLDSSASYCRFDFVSDTLYYVTGLQVPRKYNFSAVSAISTAPELAASIIEHKGILFYLSAVDTSKFFYTNFGAYDTFTSTDFLYAPAPKTSDPCKAFAKLNGQLFIITRNNKHVLYGAENATFRLDEAIGQKGTFSQESVAYDQNFIFLASDDGIYQFNGAEEKNIAANPDGGILASWTELLAKENTVLELHNNRLYVYYTPNGSAINSECFVYNIQYGVWESRDLGTYVGRTHSRFDPDDYLIVASNRVGMLMLQESGSNDYNNMGEPLTYELRTRYEHYDSPAQYKRAPIYRPHFDSVGGSYSMQVGYATDYSESPTYTDVSLASGGARFNTGVLFDSGAVFDATAQVNPMDSGVTIPGEWRRLQLRYKHYAAREPVSFDGHILSIETQRVI